MRGFYEKMVKKIYFVMTDSFSKMEKDNYMTYLKNSEIDTKNLEMISMNVVDRIYPRNNNISKVPLHEWFHHYKDSDCE